jgi:hypothetical protein
MSSNLLEIINKQLEELANDKTKYSFTILKEKVEEILKGVDIFFINNELNTKAVDMYLNNLITKRNNLNKEQEKIKLDNNKDIKYTLIEKICEKCEFESQEELIKKVELLENKTNFELSEIYISL